MKLLKQFTNPLFILVLILSFLTVGCNTETTDPVPGITTTADDGSTTVDENVLNDTLLALPLEQPDASEEAGLVFMREEEKLAHDVYIKMFALGYSKVFDNISQSEQTHTDAILALLDRYNITDPVGDNPEGVFVNADLQALYDALILQGSPSLENALYVGAEIEEIDILDIQRLVDALDGNEDIAIVYESLLKGSRNHLRAFVNNLANQGVDYAPKHLTQEVYDAIINAAMETS
ncbi:MAG: DUF2202 domain-containing protein [Gammaproteobacteria bacterium]|nr:DUF2202 domain-containing protein [Gammaproteobacteria bacterium]